MNRAVFDVMTYHFTPPAVAESFFVRHAYFLGANDPYSALKTTLKAEIDPEAWATLHSDFHSLTASSDALTALACFVVVRMPLAAKLRMVRKFYRLTDDFSHQCSNAPLGGGRPLSD
jgi:hypothetical protein